MSALASIHGLFGLLFIAACLLAFAWALALSRGHHPIPELYWKFLRMGVGGLFAVQIVTGFALLALGANVRSYLHWVYAVLILFGVGLAEMLRPGSNLREVMAPIFAVRGVFQEARALWILTIIIAILGLRAYTTGRFGF